MKERYLLVSVCGIG